MRNAWGLEGSHPTELGIMGLVFHFIEFGVGGQTLFAAGLPFSLTCVPSLHVVGVGGQTLFAAGLPTFRGDAELIQFL